LAVDGSVAPARGGSLHDATLTSTATIVVADRESNTGSQEAYTGVDDNIDRSSRFCLVPRPLRLVDVRLIPLGKENVVPEARRVPGQDWFDLINTAPIEEVVANFMPSLIWFNTDLPQHFRFFMDENGAGLKTVNEKGVSCEPSTTAVCANVFGQLSGLIAHLYATVPMKATRLLAIEKVRDAVVGGIDICIKNNVIVMTELDGAQVVRHDTWSATIMRTVAFNAKNFAAPRTIGPYGEYGLADMNTCGIVKTCITGN
jgi:hypothetical protein